jgi:hypothetical protein
MTGVTFAKRAILKTLRERGIVTVSIEYDGEGDSGQIGDILAFDARNRSVATNQPVRLALYRGRAPSDYGSLHQALDDFAWLILDHFHAGFQDNEGGFGTIRIDVAAGSVLLEHDYRVIDTVHHRTEV